MNDHSDISSQQALDYHELPRPGKISIQPTKPFTTSLDLSLAYTPGVAEPVRRIHENPENAYRYTNKGNLVAVITDGSAVLGLGRVGALAGKPVMEGKAVLFKRFADIDVFDIEVNAPSTEAFIETVVNIAPTFGGINLEDIAAPACFVIEQALRDRLEIPIFHDDQHGTAVITCAGLINALEIQGKRIEDVRIVVLGAGAAGIATSKLLIARGAMKQNIVMVDSRGVIHTGRDDLNIYKEAFAIDTPLRTLDEAMLGADVLIGVSGPSLVSKAMVKRMSKRAIVFALSNPDPEIDPADAYEAKPGSIIATGRSDYPNQVNNALCFPFIFRGALNARARYINQSILLAAVDALASLAREPVLPEVLEAYGVEQMEFGPDYILPKQFDPRLFDWVVPKVEEAARKQTD
ncbi:MAG: malate dehydrogenase [marine bacterium B5-7]|nr:MAG: malate dehydrogenase [marine bacterium B5-7]